MLTLSVVVVSQNHDWNICRLIESILNKASPFLSIEAILVDSASTDDTIKFACAYRVNIIRLREDQPLTSAAGRYVGSQYSSGKFVLFLDGDMELSNGWLEHALDVLVTDSSVAAVCGKILAKPRISPENGQFSPELDQPDFFVEAKDYGKSALYRRSVLQAVGTFNPYLRSSEGIELCNRIRRKGYRIVVLEHPIAVHYVARDEAAQQDGRIFQRINGQLANLRERTNLPPFFEQKGFTMPMIVLSTAVNAAQWLKKRRMPWLTLLLTVFLSVIATDSSRKHDLNRMLNGFLLWTFGVERAVQEFPLQSQYTNETSPVKFDIIKFVGVTQYNFVT